MKDERFAEAESKVRCVRLDTDGRCDRCRSRGSDVCPLPPRWKRSTRQPSTEDRIRTLSPRPVLALSKIQHSYASAAWGDMTDLHMRRALIHRGRSCLEAIDLSGVDVLNTVYVGRMARRQTGDSDDYLKVSMIVNHCSANTDRLDQRLIV